MADKRVTDLTSITTAPTTGVMHFVDITNQTQNAAGSSFKVTKADFLKEATASILLNTAKTGITTGQASAITANTAKVGYTEAAVTANTTVVANASAILTKLGKSTSTIAVSEVDVLTAAAYTALATKVATKLYFTT